MRKKTENNNKWINYSRIIITWNFSGHYIDKPGGKRYWEFNGEREVSNCVIHLPEERLLQNDIPLSKKQGAKKQREADYKLFNQAHSRFLLRTVSKKKNICPIISGSGRMGRLYSSLFPRPGVAAASSRGCGQPEWEGRTSEDVK